MEALALLALTTVGFLILLDRRDRRQHEERQAHRLEVAGLIGRLRSPDLDPAPVQATGPDLPAVNPEDDEDYWEAQKEALERIAQIEREGLS